PRRSSDLAAWWHPGELLDVDVDQLAAAGGLDAAHRPPRRAVHPCQPVQPVTHQHPVHRRSRHPDDPRETCRAESAGLAQRDDAPLHPGRGLMRTRPRPAGTVLEPGETLVAVAAPPLVRALPGDVHRLRGSSDGPTRFDALTEPAAALHGEGSVTVQQGLLGSCVAFDSSTLTQGAHRSADVNNVPGHNTGPAPRVDVELEGTRRDPDLSLAPQPPPQLLEPLAAPDGERVQAPPAAVHVEVLGDHGDPLPCPQDRVLDPLQVELGDVDEHLPERPRLEQVVDEE